MILDHKKRFKDSAAHKPWHDATGADWFHAGLASAMLELMRNLPSPSDGALTATANAFRIQGAQLLVSMILNLTEPTPTHRPLQDQNLNHSV